MVVNRWAFTTLKYIVDIINILIYYTYMNSTFYVWKENQESYAAVEKKQELVNKLLRVYFSKQKPDDSTAVASAGSGRVTNFTGTQSRPMTEQETDRFIPKPPDPETGYPCCTKARPCKHWVWDGNKSAYVNILTGKEREAVL